MDYNALLTPGVWRGKCGQKEEIEDSAAIVSKSKSLAKLIAKSKHFVVFTGAGISTSAGISDFRGPKGVWTLEEKKEKGLESNAKINNVLLQDAMPTKTHMAILALANSNHIKFLISQNIDGLHMFSGIPRGKMAELHGNMFISCCEKCGKESVSDTPIASVGFKLINAKCKHCSGAMRDCTLDWNDALPPEDYEASQEHCKKADLCLCLGSSLQVTPAANLPIKVTRKHQKSSPGKLVIVNLQKTPQDYYAHSIIRGYVDDIMENVMKELKIPIPDPNKLPLEKLNFAITRPADWLQKQIELKEEHDEDSESEGTEESEGVGDPEEESDEYYEETTKKKKESDEEWEPNSKPTLAKAKGEDEEWKPKTRYKSDSKKNPKKKFKSEH